MRILIVDDDAFSRRLIGAHLEKLHHSVVPCPDGDTAIREIRTDNSIDMVILDWMMPGYDGIDVCKTIRAETQRSWIYVIFLTARTNPEDLAEALDSGADDFIAKPVNMLELRARVGAGERIIELQSRMAGKIEMLEKAAQRIKQLEGILPVCYWCKRIRNDSDYWVQLEDYLREHSLAEFTHGICPDCVKEQFR